MNFETLIIFIVANILNVILQTAKTLITQKESKWGAAAMNAITFAFYTYIIVLTSSDDLSMHMKAFIVGWCNFIGVYIVKAVEMKMKKDKLWKIEVAIARDKQEEIKKELQGLDVPFNYIEGIGKYVIFNIFANTQKESAKVKEVLDKNKAIKYFVSESKNL